MIIMTVTEKFLKVAVFDCKEGKFHDVIKTMMIKV